MFIPHELALHRSRIYLGVTALSHALALAGIGLAFIPYFVKGVLAAVVAASAFVMWRRRFEEVEGLRVGQSGQIELKKGDWHPASIIGQPVVLPWLVALVLVVEGGEKRRLIVWSDSTGPDSFRRLKTWLRWGYHDAGKQ